MNISIEEPLASKTTPLKAASYSKKDSQEIDQTIFKPVAGSLKTPSIVTDYQFGNFGEDAYNEEDDLFETILKDTTGKYIGSIPKIGQNAVLGKMYQPQKQNTGDSRFATIAKGVGEAVGEISQANANLARTEYENDLRYWQDQGKYWFDPNADIKPELDEYLDAMPSSVESLMSGSMFIPDGLAEKLGDGALGATAYIHAKAGEGAAKGASMGGWWGALVGAAIGGISGAFSWGGAKREDKKMKERARKEYEKRLKEWTVNRNKRIVAQKNASYQKQLALRNKSKQEQEMKEQKKLGSAMDKRSRMEQVLQNAGSLSRKENLNRIQRWQ